MATAPFRLFHHSSPTPTPVPAGTTVTTVTTTESANGTMLRPLPSPMASPQKVRTTRYVAHPSPSPKAKDSRPTAASTPKPKSTPEKQSTPAEQYFPTAKPVPDKPGYVFSLSEPNKYVDVSGYAPGSKVKDPYSGKIFLVP